MLHAGAQAVTRSELALIPTPAGSRSHKPIPHIELVDSLLDLLDDRGLRVKREQYGVRHDGLQLFGAFDLEGGHDGRCAMMGFRQANDKSISVQLVAGARVFVCDNMSLSGDAVVLRRKHTRGLSLRFELNEGLDRYLVAQAAFEESIVAAEGRELDDDAAKRMLFDIFYGGILPGSLFSDVAGNYFKAEDRQLTDCAPRNVWGLHNAATRAIKALTPASQFTTTMRLGKHLGLVGV
jgi:hypothetical protein